MSGCGTKLSSIKRAPPVDLLTQCEKPDPIVQDTKKALEIEIKNAGKWADCRLKVDHWIDWYNADQKRTN